MSKRIVIIGGVAGGASAAARARRLSEDAQIIVIERGPHVSFANCGLPYHIGKEIPQREKLLLHTPESLAKRFNLDVRTRTEAVAIDRNAKTVRVKDQVGAISQIAYDDLILSPGAGPIRPNVPGSNARGVFTLRDIGDMDAIIAYIDEHAVKRAAVIGGGYIGVEVAEQLACIGQKVTLVEALDQVIAPLDPEMAGILAEELRKHLTLTLMKRFERIRTDDAGQHATGVILDDQSVVEAELVILGLGVRPDVSLAKNAGLEIGKLGGIAVNEYLQTSDPHIWAVGDAVEVRHLPLEQQALIALAGPANRQGRMAADNILLPRKKSYAGSLGTAVVRVFSKIAACTGANEKQLRRLEKPYVPLYLFPGSHAGYFPGAKSIAMKLLFHPQSRTLLGAQAVGEDGVEKRIDVLATAIKGGLTIDEIAELELCYAPPVGSAKDPVNLAGMMMQNVADGLVKTVAPGDVVQAKPDDAFLLDVRSRQELDRLGRFRSAVHIPLDELRGRLDELPKDRPIHVFCQSGLRSYNAARILSHHGFDVYNVTGAATALRLFQAVANPGS
ncbi:MAG: FAD-dependent oxidoreductase [Bdellovibrionales bacterium]|nr:FAD-dependent oxidoreductase [Bdellovibrionales bacterium]